MASSSKIVPFPSASANSWVEQYQQACLTPLDAGTIRVYRHILSQFTQWIEQQRGKEGQFALEQITTSLLSAISPVWLPRDIAPAIGNGANPSSRNFANG